MKKVISASSGNLWILILVLLCGFIYACRQDVPSDQGSESEKGRPLVVDSFKILNDRIAAHPDDAHSYFERAKIFLQKKNIQQAWNDASRSVQLDSNKVEYLLLFADISFRGLQIRKSLEAYNRCLNLDPSNLEANLKLAELYLYIKGYEKSIEHANNALRIDRKLVKPYFLKGFVYKETGDTAKAISSFETVIALDPSNYDAYIQLGNIHAARMNDLALQYYNSALRLVPSSTEALYDRGLYYQKRGMLDKAINDYRDILRLEPRYEDAHYNLGYIDLVFKKNYKDAIIHFSDAININKNYLEAYYNRGLCYEFTGDKMAAEKDYREALNIFPTYKLAKERLKKLTGK
ncbi:MAG: tetratricopeptide repeat protein [Bacteroidia bacterium]|nr:tetratricopeptide repeat protein [Bacteroidia bacterium]